MISTRAKLYRVKIHKKKNGWWVEWANRGVDSTLTAVSDLIWQNKNNFQKFRETPKKELSRILDK